MANATYQESAGARTRSKAATVRRPAMFRVCAEIATMGPSLVLCRRSQRHAFRHSSHHAPADGAARLRALPRVLLTPRRAHTPPRAIWRPPRRQRAKPRVSRPAAGSLSRHRSWRRAPPAKRSAAWPRRSTELVRRLTPTRRHNKPQPAERREHLRKSHPGCRALASRSQRQFPVPRRPSRTNHPRRRVAPPRARFRRPGPRRRPRHGPL
mmetsp:Transcript_15210/g.41671  ORF Transcript_15210/g.41671 Transcript_15210/m.41671 type:complete len:210 (+) Transcript_15210:113-742(+)